MFFSLFAREKIPSVSRLFLLLSRVLMREYNSLRIFLNFGPLLFFFFIFLLFNCFLFVTYTYLYMHRLFISQFLSKCFMFSSAFRFVFAFLFKRVTYVSFSFFSLQFFFFAIVHIIKAQRLAHYLNSVFAQYLQYKKAFHVLLFIFFCMQCC